MSESGLESLREGKNFCVCGIEKHGANAIQGLTEISLLLLFFRQISKVGIESLDAKINVAEKRSFVPETSERSKYFYPVLRADCEYNWTLRYLWPQRLDSVFDVVAFLKNVIGGVDPELPGIFSKAGFDRSSKVIVHHHDDGAALIEDTDEISGEQLSLIAVL